MKSSEKKGRQVADLLTEEIKASGPISFSRFMEIALYAPGCGYYSSGRPRVGRNGDFLTSVSYGPAFGQILALQFQQMWDLLGRPPNFSIVEQGANDASLANDILHALKPPFLSAVTYAIVEPFSTVAAIQKSTLSEWGPKVRWYDSQAALPPVCGVYFCNELVDAFPFHILVAREGAWSECYVTHGPSGFCFVEADVSAQALPEIHVLPARPNGTLAEVRPVARNWMHQAASKLKHGFLLVIDYGMDRGQLYDSSRPQGTFSCFQGHRRDEQPLEQPGQKDITAQVDFSALEETGQRGGLTPCGFCDQTRFLVGAAEPLLKEIEGQPDSMLWKNLKPLFHPDSMGSRFHCLCMSTLTPSPQLSGFRHSRPLRTFPKIPAQNAQDFMRGKGGDWGGFFETA